MKFYDPLHECQPNTSAIGARIQLVEQPKDALSESWVDPHPVIAYKEDRGAILSRSSLPYLDARLRLISHKFGCVIDQVLPDLQQTRTIAIDRLEILRHDHTYWGRAAGKASVQKLKDFGNQVLQIYKFGFVHR